MQAGWSVWALLLVHVVVAVVALIWYSYRHAPEIDTEGWDEQQRVLRDEQKKTPR